MQVVVICHEYGFDSIEIFYQGTAFIQPQCETGGAQPVTVHGMIGDDCDLQ
jgi:hypothetical protein